MGKKRSRNHHYIPKCLQRQFCLEDERLWYSEKDNTNSFIAPKIRNIRSSFKEKDRNTILINGQPSDIVEHKFFEKIDNYLGKIIPEVIEVLGQGKIPDFSDGQRLDFILTTYESLRRSPDFFEIDEREKGEEIVRGRISSLEKEGKALEADVQRIALRSSYELRKIGRDARVRASFSETELTQEIRTILETFQIRWAISKTKHSFILPSSCCYRIGNGGSNGIANPKMEIWMPISPKVCAVLVRDPHKKIPPIVLEKCDHIRHLNEHGAKTCRAIASHSPELLCKLTGHSFRGLRAGP